MNPNKDRGTRWESEVVRYSRANGFPLAERRALAGNADKGDILLCPGHVIIECKDPETFSWGNVENWLEETRKERDNAKASIGLLCVKIRRRGTGNAWAVMSGAQGEPVVRRLSDALIMLRAAGYGDEL